jgi:hypothetical protein
MHIPERTYWLSIAREALTRAGEPPSLADEIIQHIAGDFLDIEPEIQDRACEQCGKLIPNIEDLTI